MDTFVLKVDEFAVGCNSSLSSDEESIRSAAKQKDEYIIRLSAKKKSVLQQSPRDPRECDEHKMPK